MSTSLSRRVEGLKRRRFDPTTRQTLIADARLAKSLGFSSTEDARSYIRESSSAVDEQYTKKTIDEATRVNATLFNGLNQVGLKAEFRHQGSVTNNTHIRVHSDIDLLVLDSRFVVNEQTPPSAVRYSGNAENDLLQLRRECYRILDEKYSAADVDASGTKSLSISGGSLRRRVDVVPACWFNTQNYVSSRDETHRGVQVLDIEKMQRVTNFPFLHNRAIDIRDIRTNGRLRATIRLVKSIKADSDTVPKVSSYDIAAICWNIPEARLGAGIEHVLTGFLEVCVTLLGNEGEKLMVPNGTRTILGGGLDKAELKRLGEEVAELSKIVY